MKRLLLPVIMLVLMGLAGTALGAERAGVITMEFDLPAGDDASLWIPYPVSNDAQLITDIEVAGNHDRAAVYTDRVYGTPMLHASWPKGTGSRQLRFSFAVKRRELIRRDFPAREAAWDPADYALWLGPTSLGPIDGPVKALATEIVAGKTTVAGRARAIYDWTCDNMFRDPKTRGCGAGDVCVLLEAPGGKCADIHSVFVALARAAGVPAREVFGLRQGKAPTQDVTTWQHCWAEFYLPGYGWVPVDPGDVRKMMLKENLTLESTKTAEYRAYFWGGVDPYRVALNRGRDLVLNPPQQGSPLNYLMYPYAEIGGKPLDWLDPKSFRYTIDYRAQ